ncbi:mannosyl-glycoprotein endo-beta-N-acetylglucosaminidase [Enterococcus faecium EnGen0263]|nr:mannosyl-glycoprotein endo-beta-N-acetylglucosaminidase [Enterococcus faecium EnGen0263]
MTRKISKIGASLLVLAVATTIDYRQSEAKTIGKVVYRETAKSMLKKAMDNQPESSYWFPEIRWHGLLEKIQIRNTITSVVPLAERISKATLPNMNVTQTEEVKVVAISAMNSSINGNAPRGIDTFDANVFSYWQYIDQLVYGGTLLVKESSYRQV